METFKISSKGQVTLPKNVREWLGLNSGDKVAFDFQNGKVSLIPVRSRKVKELRGVFKTDEPITDLQSIRKHRSEELAKELKQGQTKNE